jgi:hypothetical protein
MIDHSFEYEVNIIANFTGCSYVIQEKGVNHTPIKTTNGFYLSQINNEITPGWLYVDDKTRSVQIVYEDGVLSSEYIVGDYIQVPKLTYSRFVEYHYIRIL